jgi:hypothetical protein
MKSHITTIRLLAASGAVTALALVAGPSGIANSRIPELGDAKPPPKQAAPKLRVSGQLVQIGQGPCGSETYAVVVEGHRRALLC